MARKSLIDKFRRLSPAAQHLLELCAVRVGGKENLKGRPLARIIACALTPFRLKRMDIEVILQAIDKAGFKPGDDIYLDGGWTRSLGQRASAGRPAPTRSTGAARSSPGRSGPGSTRRACPGPRRR